MTNHYYADWRDVPEKLWRWPNFSPEEIACRGDDTIRVNEAALDKLQAPARPPRRAADRPFCLSQPRLQPAGRRGQTFHASAGRGVRHFYGQP